MGTERIGAMGTRSLVTGLGDNGSSWNPYGLEMGHTQVVSCRGRFRVGELEVFRNLDQSGLGDKQTENFLANYNQYHDKNAPCTPYQAIGTGCPASFLVDGIQTAPKDSGEVATFSNGSLDGKELNGIDGVKDGFGFFWSAAELTNPDLKLPSLGIRNIIGSLNESFESVPYYQSRPRSWATDVAGVTRLQNCTDLTKVDTAAMAEFMLGFSSPLGLGTANLTSAAHQAVSDLFPELAQAGSFLEAQGAPHYEEISKMGGFVALGIQEATRPTALSRNIESDNRSIELERYVMENFKEGQFRPEPPTLTRSALFTTSGQLPKATQMSSCLGEFGLEDPDCLDATSADDDVSCSAATISPRYLSKYNSPSTSLETGFGGFGEVYYENTVRDISGGMFCEEMTVIEEEQEEEEEADMNDVLRVGSELNSSKLDSGSSFPSPLSEAPATPPPTPELDLPSFMTPPKNRNPPRCPTSSLERSNCSRRQKQTSKGTFRSTIAGKNPKELMKEQNLLLLRWRSQGISYKTIKERLGIDEAESTLRGRLRTLTKPKNERLRRPQWMEEDILLLLKVVDPDLANIKWKQVSETIVSLGGSYKFGPSTCKKQYLRLAANGRARPLAENAAGKRFIPKTGIGSQRVSPRRH